MGKRIISMILTAAMVFSVSRVTVFADNVTDETQQPAVTETTETEKTEETAEEKTDETAETPAPAEENELTDEEIAALTQDEIATVEDAADEETADPARDAVAYIETDGVKVYYDELDKAFADAKTGDTVVLLKDTTFTKLDLNGRTLTVEGAYTITYTGAGMTWSGDITFRNCTVNVNIDNANGGWIGISIGKIKFNLDNAKLTLDGTSATSGTHGIYAWNNTEINVDNGSVLTIQNFKQDAIEWDGTYSYKLNITNGSKYISDHNRSAITGTWTVNVTDSEMTWTNCSGNGSNGSNFYITNSTVTVDTTGAWGHGLSAADLIIKNSTVTAKNVGLRGITLTGNLLIDATSTVNCLDNGTSTATTTGAGLCLAKAATTGTVESGAKVTITGTQKNGLENYGTLTFADGSILTITDNNNTTSNGGGIYNAGTIRLPANAVIMDNYAVKTGGGILNAGTVTMGSDVSLYNNHAGNAGDDIYNRAAGTITLNDTGDGWKLDERTHSEGAACGSDCGHEIDGWYDDAAGTRWEAHLDDVSADHMVVVSAGTIKGETAIKAAHTQFGYLSVEKHVMSGDKSRDFAFEIRLGDTSYNEDGFSNGIRILLLKDGESETFKLPAGTTYSIREVAEGYTCRSDNASGTIEKFETAEAVFNNYKNDDPVPDPAPSTGTEGSPDTGDTSIDFAFISMLSLAAVAFITVKRKSEN